MEIVGKEDIERNRQLMLLREYFGKRRELLETRTKKFLNMYPYVNNGINLNLSRFENAINKATSSERRIIHEAYLKEKKYWLSGYVIDNCDNDVHVHIVNTLAAMEKILSKISMNSGNNTMSGLGVNSENMHSNQLNNSCNNWGKAGEEAVEYVLKWLPDVYCVIEKDCVSKYGNNTIVLENLSFTDEVQEFDHLVIGPQGIFNIETKNYSGKVYIDRAGNWVRLKKGETDWVPEENPAQQLFRHHVMLESIIGKNVPIIDIICMSHPSLMISGQENSNIPIVKKDLLADFIVNYRPAGLSTTDIEVIKDKINSCKISK